MYQVPRLQGNLGMPIIQGSVVLEPLVIGKVDLADCQSSTDTTNVE